MYFWNNWGWNCLVDDFYLFHLCSSQCSSCSWSKFCHEFLKQLRIKLFGEWPLFIYFIYLLLNAPLGNHIKTLHYFCICTVALTSNGRTVWWTIFIYFFPYLFLQCISWKTYQNTALFSYMHSRPYKQCHRVQYCSFTCNDCNVMTRMYLSFQCT